MKGHTTLELFFEECLNRSLPIAIYRLPNTRNTYVVAQRTSSTRTFRNQKITTKGFLFAPFVSNKKAKPILISPDIFCEEKKLSSEILTKITGNRENPSLKFSESRTIQSTRKEFEDLISDIKTEIAQKRYSKIVAARVTLKNRSRRFSAVKFYRALCREYPSAFISVVFSPLHGLWIGATPEVLLNESNTSLQTFSLAGTKTNARVKWSNKEYKEQEFVTAYLEKALKKVTNKKISIRGPKTVKAGNLYHLLTTFVVDNFSKADWKKVAESLHPTPAVAGIPKTKAVKFISKKEKSSREFYSGYLGPINIHNQVNLFVNIRCMRVYDSKLALFTGCGITLDSDAAKEWRETEAKTQTLTRVLDKLH